MHHTQQQKQEQYAHIKYNTTINTPLVVRVGCAFGVPLHTPCLSCQEQQTQPYSTMKHPQPWGFRGVVVFGRCGKCGNGVVVVCEVVVMCGVYNLV